MRGASRARRRHHRLTPGAAPGDADRSGVGSSMWARCACDLPDARPNRGRGRSCAPAVDRAPGGRHSRTSILMMSGPASSSIVFSTNPRSRNEERAPRRGCLPGRDPLGRRGRSTQPASTPAPSARAPLPYGKRAVGSSSANRAVREGMTASALGKWPAPLRFCSRPGRRGACLIGRASRPRARGGPSDAAHRACVRLQVPRRVQLRGDSAPGSTSTSRTGCCDHSIAE
jgi:hypothetical protein